MVESGQTLVIDSSWTVLDLIVRGRVEWSVSADDVVLSASRILVERNGTFWAGNSSVPILGRGTIELRTSDSDAAGTGLMEANGMRDGAYPTIEINGKAHSHSWTLLSEPAMPTDTFVIVQDDVDWLVGDEIVISGWNPSRARESSLTPGFVSYEPKSSGGTGLRTVNNAQQLSTDDHTVIAGELGMILKNGDLYLRVHCDTVRCCRSFANGTWDCDRPPLAPQNLPCVEHRDRIPSPPPESPSHDDDKFACCVYASASYPSVAVCADPSSDTCGGQCEWNLDNDNAWSLAEQARLCESFCMRDTGSGYSERRLVTSITSGIDGGRVLHFDRPLANTHPGVDTMYSAPTGEFVMSTRSEVLRLSRNFRITGASHTSIKSLSSSVHELAERGASTQLSGNGRMSISNVEVDHCGKQSHMGRYCLHFHLSGFCGTACAFVNNSVHDTFQRGIVVHGTHESVVSGNVIYNARGANIYMEDGNEYANNVLNNVAVCVAFHWCKISPNTWTGTNGKQQDYSEQGGIWGISPSNHYIGNRMVLHENGFFIDSKNPFANGQGIAFNRICAGNQPLLTVRGNVQHSNTGFGFYLNENWPKNLDVTENGLLVGDSYSSCRWFTDDGVDNGRVGFIEDGFDWLNNFVGAYDQGDIGYKRQVSYQNNHGIYWKTTKNFAGMPFQPHIEDSLFLENNLWLGPGGHGTFGIRNTTFKQKTIEANHHCNEGALSASGSLCVPQYVLDDVHFILDTGGDGASLPFEFGTPGANRPSNRNSAIFIMRKTDVYGTMYDDTSAILTPDYYDVDALTNDADYSVHQPNLKSHLKTSCASYGSVQQPSPRSILVCDATLQLRRFYAWSDSVSNAAITVTQSDGASATIVDTIHLNPGDGGAPADRSWSTSGERMCPSGQDCYEAKSGYSFHVLVGWRITIDDWPRASPFPYAIEFSDEYVGADEWIDMCLDGECRRIYANHSRAFISAWGPQVANQGAWPLSTAEIASTHVQDYNVEFKRYQTSSDCSVSTCDLLAEQSLDVSYSAECAADSSLPRCGIVANGYVYPCCRNDNDVEVVRVSIRQNVDGQYAFEPSIVQLGRSTTLRIVNDAGSHPLYYEDESSAFTQGTFEAVDVHPFEENFHTNRVILCTLHGSMRLEVGLITISTLSTSSSPPPDSPAPSAPPDSPAPSAPPDSPAPSAPPDSPAPSAPPDSPAPSAPPDSPAPSAPSDPLVMTCGEALASVGERCCGVDNEVEYYSITCGDARRRYRATCCGQDPSTPF